MRSRRSLVRTRGPGANPIHSPLCDPRGPSATSVFQPSPASFFALFAAFALKPFFRRSP